MSSIGETSAIMKCLMQNLAASKTLNSVHPETSDKSEVVESILNEFFCLTGKTEVSRLGDRSRGLSSDLIASCFSLGLFSITVPEEYGGVGATIRDYCSLISSIASCDASLALTVAVHAGGALPCLVLGGSDGQKMGLLSEMDTRQNLMGFAMQEEIGAFDPQRPESVLTPLETGGSQLRRWDNSSCPSYARKLLFLNIDKAQNGQVILSHLLNGRKPFVMSGASAKYVFILAKPSNLKAGLDGGSLCCIAQNQSGMSAMRHENTLGLRALEMADLSFKDVNIDKTQLIGSLGQGALLLNETLPYRQLGLSSVGLGLARKSFGKAQEYAADRVQFKRKLNQNELIQLKLVDMECLLHQMKAMIFFSAESYQKRKPDRNECAMMTRLFCSRSAWNIISETMQIYGGIGYMEESGIPQLLRDCATLGLIGIPDECQLAWNLLDSMKDSPKTEASMLPHVHPELKTLAHACDEVSKEYSDSLLSAGKLNDSRSGHVARRILMQIGISLFALRSSLFYTSFVLRQAESQRSARASQAVRICQHLAEKFRHESQLKLDEARNIMN